MRTLHLVSTALALATTGYSQVREVQLNEILAEVGSFHDDQEYIELKGEPAASLDGHMVLAVRGVEVQPGTLDRAWNLMGESLDGSGLYTLGNIPVACAEFYLGVDDGVMSYAATYYLIRSTDPAAVIALVGTNIDGDGDHITDIATDPRHSIIDIIAMLDGYSSTNHVYDGAQTMGPDGRPTPIGIYRGSGGSMDWCDFFLNWSGLNQTPCAVNGACDDGIGTRFCQANPNSTGRPARIMATGSDVAGTGEILTLIAASVPSQPGIFFHGANPINVPFGVSFLCVGGGIVRVGVVFGSSGVATDTVDNGVFSPGDVRYFQYWMRDPAAGGPINNTTDAIRVTFQ